MFYKKRLNNNAVVAVDSSGNEQILTGCGLGFKIKIGEIVDESKVEKIFTLKDTTANQRLQELLKTLPVEYISVAEEIVAYAQQSIEKVNESAIVSLSDHIYMAVERKKQGITVKNMMLWDIKKFYRDEFLIGEYALNLIQQKVGVQLDEDEAGFIALHIVNAQLDLHLKSVQKITKLMQEIETIVRMTFAINLDVNSVYYYRFITHLKFFAERLFSGKIYEGDDIDNMLEIVCKKYPKAYECVDKIAAFVAKKYAYDLSNEELLYLTIHISRVVQKHK